MSREPAERSNVITLTFDVDWAPEYVLEDTLQLLQSFGVEATFFATHDSSVLKKNSAHELALHPNFNPILNGTVCQRFQDIFDDLHAHYPNAKGTRSHSLVTSSPLLDYVKKRGLHYESNFYSPFGHEPFRDYHGLWRVPFHWSDAQTLCEKKSFGWELFKKNKASFPRGIILSNAFSIYAFHPIHVFLNSETLLRYEQAKGHMGHVKNLLSFQNKSTTPGARDFLLSLLQEAKTSDIGVVPLISALDNFELTHS